MGMSIEIESADMDLTFEGKPSDLLWAGGLLPWQQDGDRMLQLLPGDGFHHHVNVK